MWYDMVNAPRDGTRIVLFSKNENVLVSRWYNQKWQTDIGSFSDDEFVKWIPVYRANRLD